MKIVNRVLPYLLVVFAVFGIGCSRSHKADIQAVVSRELDLLKNLDSDTTQKYVPYAELFPDMAGQEPSEEIRDVFTQFFKDFDYKILAIQVDKKSNTAQASVRIKTLDAASLAKDYAAARLQSEIRKTSPDTDASTGLSLEERILILNQLLKTNEYESRQTTSTIGLSRSSGSWVINRTYSLENDLVGGLMADLSNPDILSPPETLDIYLHTIQNMDLPELQKFLGIDSILADSDPDLADIADALMTQFHKCYDYSVGESTINGYNASVSAHITTLDSAAILDAYQQELEPYLASPDALIDGASVRYEKSLSMLLSQIRNNEKTTENNATFHLTNDGVSWKLEDPGTKLGSAIFGSLSDTPESDLLPDQAVEDASAN